MLNKIKKILIIIVWLFLLFPQTISAQEDFTIDSKVLYGFEPSGKANVIHKVTLSNNNADVFAKDYILNLKNIEPYEITAYDASGPLDIRVEPQDGSIKLSVEFADPVVGAGSSRTFNIAYSANEFATKTGEVWEISIPKLTEDALYRNYTTELKIPITFGKEAYVSPEPSSKFSEELAHVYVFDKETSKDSSISLGFGNFQVFSFTLNYHLENPLNSKATTEIPIPPDTPFQKVFYTSITPTPDNVSADADGNWIAQYQLEGRERIDVTTTGAVQIFSSPTLINLNQNPLFTNSYLGSTEFWQADDQLVLSVASAHKSPRDIYNYIVSNFEYDYDRVQPNVKRLGALDALINPESAICMEFTDAFIALSRANGIPAREINGFAYSENPNIQPLSLVADVLHAWPEYWDTDKNSWIPVDPTWGSTTGGVDYFEKLDLRHFAFVIHGSDDSKPFPPGSYKLGPNPQKDVFVNFGRLPDKKVTNAEIEIEMSSFVPLLPTKAVVTITNPGPIALYETSAIIMFDSTIAKEIPISSLLPFQSQDYEIDIPFSLLGRNTPEKVSVLVGASRVEAKSGKEIVIIYNAIAMSVIFFILVGIVFLIVKKGLRQKYAKNTENKEEISED